MKKVIFILFVIAVGPLTYGQEVESPPDSFKNDVGVDFTRFFRFLNSNLNSDYPYYLTYRRNFDNSSLRAGFGGGTSISTLTDSIALRSVATNFSMRIGFEWQKNFDKRWQIYYGLDVTYVLANQHSEGIRSGTPEFWVRTRKISEIGFGPNLGVKFKINKRLSLATEANFIAAFSKMRSTTDYELTNSFDSNTETDEFGTSFYYPTSIFLLIYL